MRCTNCNSEVADGMQFCPYCGSPISVSMPKVCSKCGTEIEEGEKFCTNCGSPIVFPEQPQHPQQGQPQQPQQGQYQQPQQGQYQQPYQGQYQQPQQGQYQQPYQGQYQQPFVQQKPQLPHRPQLTFMEAINLASHRLQDVNGRSRRSEYWWWVLAVGLGTVVLGFIPYVGNLLYIVQFFLLYAITIRRLHDCSAPDWLSKMYPGVFGLYSVCMVLFGFYTNDPHGFARDIIRFFGDGSGFYGIFILAGILSLVVFVYSIKDSNPDIDPMHGPSPKYTL